MNTDITTSETSISTTEPTTSVVTTEPTTSVVTTEPTTGVVTTEPTTSVVTTEPTTGVVTTGFVDEVKTQEKPKYNVVKVTNVEMIPISDNEQKNIERCLQRDQKYHWAQKSCTHNSYYSDCTQCEVLGYFENGEKTHYGRGFIGAFLNAYNNHRDLILSPDDVWTIISLWFSKYVNDNAEKMRSLFVSHEGQKKLTVVTENDLDETKWNEFFEKMIVEIRGNISTIDDFESNFSTTGILEKVMSTAIIMNTFKQYFSYGRCIPCCGIRNVLFTGTLDDWKLLVTKTMNLSKYDGTTKLRSYVSNLVPILEQFVRTYQGDVDTDFWSRVYNSKLGSLGSGSTSYISGWILNFYGFAGQTVDSGDIDENTIDVPINIDNKLTGIQKTVKLVGGFSGVSQITTGEYIAYRPHVSFAIIA